MSTSFLGFQGVNVASISDSIPQSQSGTLYTVPSGRFAVIKISKLNSVSESNLDIGTIETVVADFGAMDSAQDELTVTLDSGESIAYDTINGGAFDIQGIALEYNKP